MNDKPFQSYPGIVNAGMCDDPPREPLPSNERSLLIERYFQQWLQYFAAGRGEFEELRRAAFEAGWSARETQYVISTPSETFVRQCPYCGQPAPESQIERPADYCHHDVPARDNGGAQS